MPQPNNHYVMDRRVSSGRTRAIRNRYTATPSAIPDPLPTRRPGLSEHDCLFSVHKRMLGRPSSTPSTHPFLRRIRSLQARHLPDGHLPQLTDLHVVYAIVCISRRHGLRTSKVYVGETSQGAITRFQRHLQLARKIARGALHQRDHTNSLHYFMARHDLQSFRIIPLEKVSHVKSARLIRERFWITALHAFNPHGFNVAGKFDLFRATAGLPYPPLSLVPTPQHTHAHVTASASPPAQASAASPSPPVSPTPSSPTSVPLAPRYYAYRDYARRVRFLCATSASPAFQPTFLDTYKKSNLHRMLQCLRRESHIDLHISHNDHRRVSHLLSQYLYGPGQRVKSTCPPLVTLYTTRAWDQVKLQKIVTDDSITSLLPRAVRHVIGRDGAPLAAWKYGKTLGQLICNYQDIGRNLPDTLINRIITQPCACSKPCYAPYIHPSCGHVLTTDVSVVHDLELQTLMLKGTGYRPDLPRPDLPPEVDATDPVTVMNHLFSSAVGTFVKRMDIRHRLSPDQFHAWSVALRQSVANRLTWLRDHSASFRRAAAVTDPGEVHTPYDRRLKRLVKSLQADLVFTFVDKGANNFAFVCKKHYLLTLRQELATPTYTITPDSPLDIGARHRAWLAARHIQHPMADQLESDEEPPPLPLPYLYASVKFHKDPPSVRFIAGARGSSLEVLSLWLTSAYRMLLPEADSLWAHTYRRAGLTCNSSWILIRSEDFLPVVDDLNSSVPRASRSTANVRLQTFDFSTLYTTLGLTELKARMAHLHTALFQHRLIDHPEEQYLHLSFFKGESSWAKEKLRNTVSAKYVKADDLSEWLNYLVDNTYVTHGSTFTYKQDIGIPMGTNCAVFVANLFLYTYELEHIITLVQNVERGTNVDPSISLLRKHCRVKRFVDDLIAVDHPDMPRLVSDIYPPMLTVNLSADDVKVDFLDMHIHLTPDLHWAVSIYDKRRLPKFAHLHLIKYPHINSALGDSAKYGVLVSQFHRFRRLCSEVSNFISEVALLVRTLAGKGYNLRLLLSRLHALLHAYGGQYGTSAGALYTDIRRQVLV